MPPIKVQRREKQEHKIDSSLPILIAKNDNIALVYFTKDQLFAGSEKKSKVIFPRNATQRIEVLELRPDNWKMNFYNKSDVIIFNMMLESEDEVSKVIDKLISPEVNLFGYMKKGN